MKSPSKAIKNRIYIIRGLQVMLDSDLAELYQVKTKHFNQAVKRNLKRFPEDFMFKLNKNEFEVLRSQFVTSKEGSGGRRYLPYAFTEQGIAMLSSVISSDIAIEVNILIMRTFVNLRQHISDLSALERRLSNLENSSNSLFKVVFERLDSSNENRSASKRKKITLL